MRSRVSSCANSLVGLGEERAFDAAASVLELHEGLAVAALAHADDLTPATIDGRFLAPAAALAFRTLAPQPVEVAEVDGRPARAVRRDTDPADGR